MIPVRRQQETTTCDRETTFYPKCFTGVTSTVTRPVIDEMVQPTICYEDVVISGVSGRFPESTDMEVFCQNLLRGVEKVTEVERQCSNRLMDLTKKIRTNAMDLTSFDAEFFGVSPKIVEKMDPKLRMLLEVCYECIFDSGVNPIEIKGTKTGVFIGATNSDVSVNGCATSVLANRLSHFFDFKGPSYVIDTACSSSLVALDAAVNAIRTGQCEYAIVGGVNMLTCPINETVDCKMTFNETIGCVFIQKKTTCRRFYVTVVNSKVNTECGVTYPTCETQKVLLRSIYNECKVDPCQVAYIECHGNETRVIDPQELNTIADVFIRSPRTTPLMIGLTKSNLKYPESGIVSLIKMIVSAQTGIIPATVCVPEVPIRTVPALIDGRIKIVNTNTKYCGGYMALNSFGSGGANVHIVIKPNTDLTSCKSFWTQEACEIVRQPRLFNFCSRTQEGLERVLDFVENNTNDLACHALLKEHAKCSATTHPFRGFTVLNSDKPIREINDLNDCQDEDEMSDSESESETEVESENECDEIKGDRPVWYVFSGMGSQYVGMGKEMMKIETFRQSMIKSCEILKPYGVNLIDIIYGKPCVYENTINSFVTICAIQMAIVDCLERCGVEADGLIGHSIGELVCAYADKCLTAEETLLCAYYRGKCIEEANLPTGAMATVGLTWEECKRRCPSGVVPACHNSSDVVTISGAKKVVIEFIEQLKQEGIFAKEIDSSDVAFHSHYMTSIAPMMKNYLSKVICTPKLRSSKWISTSIPEQRWSTDLARFCSPDYHVNTLCNPVLFQEGLKCIPSNAICIEIAPNCILKSILKKSLSCKTTCIALIKKDVTNPIEYFLTQLGRIHNEGIDIDSFNLMVPVECEESVYPVPVTTRFLSPYCEWNHNQKWSVPRCEDLTVMGAGVKCDLTNCSSYKYVIDTTPMCEEAYLSNHVIDGRVVYPTTGYLCLVWKTFAKMQRCQDIEQFPVEFENVQIIRNTFIEVPRNKICLVVRIQPTSGLFEIVEDKTVIVTGRVCVPEKPIEYEQDEITLTGRCQPVDLMECEQIYNQLRTRGYQYENEFRPIVKADIEGTCGELTWTNKWVPFLEGMIQMNILGQKCGLLLPTRIRSIKINPKSHLRMIESIKTTTKIDQVKTIKKMSKMTIRESKPTTCVIPVIVDPYTNTTVCGCVEITGLHTTVTPKMTTTVEQRHQFVSYIEKPCDEEYVYVDNDDMTDSITRPECQSIETPCQYHCDVLEHYLNEIKRFSTHIIKKVQCPKSIVQTIVPSPMPKCCQKQINIRDLTINPKNVCTPIECTHLIEGGKLLQLLKNAANIDSTDGEYIYRVQRLFNYEFAYFKALEEDIVLNELNKCTCHLRSLLETVIENTKFDMKQKIRIVEISPSYNKLFGIKVNNYLKTIPTIKNVEYNYVPLENTIACDDYLMEVNKGLTYPIRKIECDLVRNCQMIDEVPMVLRDCDLVIMNGCLNAMVPTVCDETQVRRFLNTIMGRTMKPGAFMILHEYTNNLETVCQLRNLEKIVMCKQYPTINTPVEIMMNEMKIRNMIEESLMCPISLKSDGKLGTMMMYRRSMLTTPVCKPTIMDVRCEEKILIDDMDKCTWIEKVRCCLTDDKCERVWLISEKSPRCEIVELIRRLCQEINGEKIRCIFFTDRQPVICCDFMMPKMIDDINVPKFTQWTQLFDQIRKADLVMNVFRAGRWGTLRQIVDNETTCTERQPINVLGKQVLCKVSHAGLNVCGEYMPVNESCRFTPELINCMEFSGEYTTNETEKVRCFGMLPSKGLVPTIVADKKYLWEVPCEWTMEEACTVPVAYTTAYYGLVVRGCLKRGETVLIHTCLTPVGQAAISIALGMGCRVICNVPTVEKREYLRSIFPRLKEDCFTSPREILFEKEIMKITQGCGVDVVFNSIAENRLENVCRVLSTFGRLVECGKYDLTRMSCLKNVTCHCVSCDCLFEEENNEWRSVYELIKEGIATGVVRPINCVVFEMEKIEEAIRCIEQGKHCGKVLVRVCEPREIEQETTVCFSPIECFVITGGLSIVGLELAQWCVERGARHIILTSTTGVCNVYHTRKIRQLREEFGCRVQVLTCDVKDETECMILIKEAVNASVCKRIGGIIHLESTLTDCIGTYNLDKCIRCLDLVKPTMFVVCTPKSVEFDRMIQTVERICEVRRREGKCAFVVRCGLFDECFDNELNVCMSPIVTRCLNEFLTTLECLITKYRVSEDVYSTRMIPLESKIEMGIRNRYERRSIVEIIANILGLKDVKQWFNERSTLIEMGLDNIMAVEIKNILEQSYNLPLNVREIQQLTLEKIRRIETTIPTIVNGKSCVIPEVEIPTIKMTKKINYLMPTKVVEKLNNIELLPNQIPLFVVHPIEGHVNMLKSWARHMKYPVFGIQYTQEASVCDTIEKLAEFYCQQIEKVLINSTTVYPPRVHLCGYSFGANVAYEMSTLRKNLISSLCLLDGNNSFLPTQMTTYRNKIVDNTVETECEALCTFVQQYVPIITKKDLIECLITMPTFEHRVAFCVREVMTKSQFNFEPIDLEQAVRSFVERIIMSYKYQPTRMVRLNQILLVRCQQRNNLIQTTFGEECGLERVFNGKVQIQVVDGDNRSFLEGNNGYHVAEILNEYLCSCC